MKSDDHGGYRLPLLPLRDIIVFPHMVVPLFVGRPKSMQALEEAMAGDKQLLLAAQRRAKTDDPNADDIFSIGTVGHIIQLLRFPKGPVKVLVEGRARANIRGFHQLDPFFVCEVDDVEEPEEDPQLVRALMASTQDVFEDYVKLNTRIPPEMLVSVRTIDEPGRLSDTIVAHVALKLKDKQELLETPSPAKRLERLSELMQGEIEIRQVEKKLRTRVKKQMEKQQKEYYLNEQMQAIQKELGDRDEFKNELTELEQKIKQKRMSKEAKERCQKELKKLKQMSPMSAEATVVRNYLDWVIALPWEDKTEDRQDINAAQAVLDEEHYGLKKVKERILEYLAVQTLVTRQRGPILCLVGPPGVGKTSLARSIAHATGRRFVRQSLGGVRDEAEIRGHRRTYIGSMPGKVIQSLKKVGKSNPLFLLDEIDKMGQDFRGDPSSALLEVLDPEQNHTFADHYLEVDYDLSDVMFVTTSNTLNIPGPLMDRMEIIRLSGYTEEEKFEIARRHLIPETLKENGLEAKEFALSDEMLMKVVRDYTREAGVRNLKREISKLMRKSVRSILQSKSKKIEITPEILEEYLGTPYYRNEKADAEPSVGLVTGLAWTAVGGETLTIEAIMTHGKGRMTVTGNLKEVMKESISAANGYVRSRATDLGIKPPLFDTRDIHVHVPEGATPKDGPSAGIAMATAIVSVMTGIPVRHDVAMTGEVTLRGRVLPIGGLKEKLLAALRFGIKTVLIPADNVRDLKEIPEIVTKGMEIIPVSRMDEVLSRALVKQPEPIEWKYEEDASKAAPVVPDLTIDGDEAGTVAH